jgi:diguanylate cyclase (GGDEF)-like protein
MNEPRPKILVCDDARTIRALIETVLGAEYELCSVASGEEAVARLTDFTPDLFLSDLVMEGMDGYELCRRVRSMPGLEHVPFVLLTSKTDDESRAVGLEVGADDYLFKPLRPRELLARVRSLLSLRHAHKQLAKQKEELEQANARLSLLALQDGLTGLYNHRCFQERLREEVGRAQRYGRALTLVFFDIDHFKELNDRYGHLLGDEALASFGKLLSGSEESIANKRTSDVAARYGGEEIVLLLPETDRQGGVIKAQRVCAAVSQLKLSVASATMTVSAGVAEYPRDAGSAQELIKRADEALYQAKRRGRNRVVAQGEFQSGEPGEVATPLRSYRTALREISEIMSRDRHMAVFYVELPELGRLEKEYGSDTAQAAVKTLVDRVVGDPSGVLAVEDMVTAADPGRTGLVVFPGRARGSTTPEPALLDGLRDRLMTVFERGARHAFADLIQVPMRVAVGYAVGLGVSHYAVDRQIEQLVRDAAQSAHAFRARRNEHDKIELQLLLLNEQLRSVFQPIVSIDGSKIVGYEALVRGPANHPLASPLDLLLTAARAELEWELDRACLRSAFRHAAELPPDVHFAVNVLPSTLYDRDFGTVGLSQLLSSSSLPAERLILEVTEQSVISNLARFREALGPLRKAGIRIALDDVGVANANLEQINAIEPDFIKLDRVIVNGASTSKPRLELIRSMVTLARSFGAKVVAEGVEGPEDWQCLRDVGVDYAQGFYFARPGPPFPSMAPVKAP